MGVLDVSPIRIPTMATIQGIMVMEDPEGGMMVMTMEMIMMVHPSRHLHQRPKSIRRRHQAVAGEEEMTTRTKILRTVMRSLFDV
jgi:hypothetical protein